MFLLPPGGRVLVETPWAPAPKLAGSGFPFPDPPCGWWVGPQGATPLATQAGNVQLIHLASPTQPGPTPRARFPGVCRFVTKALGGCCPTALPTPKQSGHSEWLPSVPGHLARARRDQGREGLHVWSPRPASAEARPNRAPSLTVTVAQHSMSAGLDLLRL